MSPFLIPFYSDGPVICTYGKNYHLSTLDPCHFWILYFPILKSMCFWDGQKTFEDLYTDPGPQATNPF